MNRVEITDKAKALVEKIRKEHGAVIFHQSGGCCDGSAPMLLNEDDFYIDDNDIRLGVVANIEFYMNKAQFEYWKHTHLTVDVVEGRGASFSLEIPYGYRFIVQSRLLTQEENEYFNLP